MRLCKNLLLEYFDGQCNRIERVLWLNTENVDIVTIELNNPTAIPVWQKCLELETAITTGAMHILEVDPYASLLRKEDEIDEKHKKYRDQAWSVIAPLVETGEQIFLRAYRGQLIADAAKHSGRTIPVIYKYLRRYWVGGQVKNALLPHFDNCGGEGKLHGSDRAKRGRPHKQSLTQSDPIGVNIDSTIRESFRRGIKLFYETRTARTLKEAFQLTLENVYLIDIEPYFQQASEKLTLQVLKTDVKQTTPDDNSVTHSPPNSCSDNLISAFPSKLGSSQSHTLDELGLPSIVASGAKRKVAPYESLQTAGFIKDATEYLLEDLSG